MKQMEMEDLNKITEAIIGAAIEVQRNLGPGLLESAYRECLRFELVEQGYDALKEVPLPLLYKGTKLDCGYRMDLLVNDAVIESGAESIKDMGKVMGLLKVKMQGRADMSVVSIKIKAALAG